MHFVHPDFFILLAIPALMFFFLLKQGSHSLEKYFEKHIFKKMQQSNRSLSTKARLNLFILILILMITALARPVSNERTIKIEAKGSDIVIALDISRSMLANDLYPNRLEWAKNKALGLVNLAKQNRIGVIAFANSSYIVSPLSFDKEAVKFLIDKLDTTSITQQGTNFKQMLDSSSHILEKGTDRFVVLLTDGGDQEDFSEEIELANEAKITLFVIGTGSDKGVPVALKPGEFIKDKNGKILISYMNESVKDIAIQSGGAYMNSVTSDDDIIEVMRRIEAKANEQTLKEQEIKQYTELFYYPLTLALFILLFALSSFPKRATAAVLALFLYTPEMKADLLNFQKLQEAKEAYAQEDYKKSAYLYNDFQNSEALYNRANALYKSGNYAQAAKEYEKLKTEDKELSYKSAHNLGNSYAKEATKESLEKAISAYENALSIKDDKQTAENLETVKKALEQMKEQEQQQQNQDKNKDQNQDKNQQDKQKGEQDQQKQDQQKQDQQGDQKENQESKEQQKEQDSKEKEQQEQEKNSKSQDEKNKEEKEKEEQSEQGSDTEEEQKKEDEKEQQSLSEEEQKENNEAKESEQIAQNEQQINPDEISDLEMKKWQKMLKSRGVQTRLYEMKQTQQPKGVENENPW